MTRTRAFVATTLSWLAGSSGLACSARSDIDDSSAPVDPYGTADPDLEPPRPETSDKLDLLLVVDNSSGMVDAQAVLASTLPYLLDRLVDPSCVNGLGNVVDTPEGEVCETGVLEFPALRDIHLGVVSTSLGGLGADTCSSAVDNYDPSMEDGARLLDRDANGGVVPTYDNLSFLWWDPGKAQTPPGESDLAALRSKFLEIAGGVGARGCGFESQLETVYRFLVDDRPYETIEVDGNISQAVGTDAVVLQQRADFLRPDSAVAIILLTEENDCSTKVGGSNFLMRQGGSGTSQLFHLPRARSECEDDVGDPCCASCGAQPAAGCPPNADDPACQLPAYDAVEDHLNLRCFDQERRFGETFLYPTERYVRGLTDLVLVDAEGREFDNPLFAGGRSPELVIFAGIVGVPWQDIAIDPKDLSAGYLPGNQIDWSLVLGENGAPPRDPLMIESVEPRSGENPATSSALAPPSASSPQQNPINGHEREIPLRDDLQYACIFRLPEPVDCAIAGCACGTAEAATDPLCQADDGSYGTLRRYSAARPSVRVLEVLRDLGERGVPASICAEDAASSNLPSFGYRPAVDALLRTLRRRLRAP